jgi:DNA-binding winged helix-turn-helix (wHTH) protein
VVPVPGSSPAVVRFGVFEAALDTGELRRQGVRVALQEQPFQVLAMLLERPGVLVTRDELHARIWPEAVFVDFEHGLNKAVSKLRRALGDSADDPRFIETLARRGYRFVAPVEGSIPPPRAAAAFRVIWEERALPLPPGETVIGRDPDVSLWVDATSVSRRHARIVVSEGTATIEDLGSKNGTFVNGHRIEGAQRLADSDQIRVGAAVLVLRAYRNSSTQTQAT